MSEGEKKEFIEARKNEILPSLEKKEAEAVRSGQPLSDAEEEKVLEQFETKVFVWNRPKGAPGAKRVLLEAAEPAAYNTLVPIIRELQKDERCAGITLVTDNVAGKRFTEEQKNFSFEQIRQPGQPVMADIPVESDVVLILVEPKDTPEKMLLYSGKSVYGTDSAKEYLYLDGLLGGTIQKLLTESSAVRMDHADGIFVANDLAKDLLESAVPSTEGRTTVAGSILIESLRNTLPDAAQEQKRRHELRGELGIPEDALTVLYSGFPSQGFEALGGRTVTNAEKGELTLNQETFAKTLSALQKAATESTERQFALVVRNHPRAAGQDNNLQIPESLPSNLHVVWANGPKYNYDDVVNSVVDIIACQSTSTEILLAPYRGRVPAIFGYEGEGLQATIDKNIFGTDGAAALARSDTLFYIQSEDSFAHYVEQFHANPARMPLPPDPIAQIMNVLLSK